MIFKNNKKILLAFILLLTMFFAGCRNGLIPEKDMVQILVKVFLTDATVSSPPTSNRFNKKDSIDYYKSIYEPMGYSEKQFEKSIDYYFDNPNHLDQLLDKVINELAQIETRINADLASQKHKIKEAELKNLWKQKKGWVLPKDGKQESIDFVIEVKGLGEYIIMADVAVYPSDGSTNPALVSWFYFDDGSEKGLRMDEKIVYYIKDGVTRTINLTNALTDTMATHFAGCFMHHQAKEGKWEKRSEVKNISINYNPLPISYPVDYSRSSDSISANPVAKHNGIEDQGNEKKGLKKKISKELAK